VLLGPRRLQATELTERQANQPLHPHGGFTTVLVLSRKVEQKIWIGNDISFSVIQIRGDTVKIGIDAPKDVAVHRDEVKRAIERKKGLVS
jgi:carbon storage regulator